MATFNSLYYLSLLLELVVHANNPLSILFGQATHYHESWLPLYFKTMKAAKHLSIET